MIDLIAAGGCGTSLALVSSLDPAIVAARGEADANENGANANENGANAPVATPVVVVLNWEGGQSSLYRDLDLKRIDLGSFTTSEGETLAEREEEFKELVARRIELILNGLEELDVRVVESPPAGVSVETTVHLTQELSPNGRVEIGRAHYDPCNGHYDDEAVIFGEQVHRLGDGFSFDEWVTVFSNVSAHETAHTFGFAHLSRVRNPPTQRSAYVELMLDNHTMSEMRRPQRMMSGQTNCPTDDPSASGTMSGILTAPLLSD